MILMLLDISLQSFLSPLRSLLMSRHLRHASVLAACLLLLLNLLIVQSLLLLFGHVATGASHTGLWLWHGSNLVGRVDLIGGVDTILCT